MVSQSPEGLPVAEIAFLWQFKPQGYPFQILQNHAGLFETCRMSANSQAVPQNSTVSTQPLLSTFKFSY